MKTGKYQKTWDYKCKRSTRIFGVETKVGVHLIPDGVQTHEVPARGTKKSHALSEPLKKTRTHGLII